MEKINELLGFFNNISIQSVVNICVAVLIFMVFNIFSDCFSFSIIKLTNLKEKDKKVIKKNGFYKPLKTFFILLGLYLGLLFLGMSGEIYEFSNRVFRILIIALLANGMANSLGPKSLFFKKMQNNVKFAKDTTLLSFFSKTLKVVIYVFAGMIIISELGYDVNGIIAGLGIGGVAIALAAQETAKNLFGGFVIIADKPFIVGDWIETPSLEGVVESISFRSTRVRTFQDSITTMPNSILSNESIINWSQMNKRRILFNLNIAIDTPLKNINNAINSIQSMLIEHENVLNDSMYIHLNEITENGIHIMIYFYTSSVGFKDYLAVKENVNYKILQVLEKEKCPLAYTTNSVQLKK